MTLSDLIAENRRRCLLLDSPYDPVTGNGASGPRRPIVLRQVGSQTLYLPESMVADSAFHPEMSGADYVKLRCRHDFDFWCVTCVRIRHKLTGEEIPFRLNGPQRRVAAMMEDDRRAGRPIRLIMLKARQWGGSTLVQMYLAWIQTVHRTNWHSLVCAHVRDTSSTIRGMYSRMLECYPAQYWEGDAAPGFKAYEGSRNTREISGRSCRVTVASCQGQEAVRGQDNAMAHLSEVAFWKDTDNMAPEAFIRAVCAGIPQVPMSVVVLESTANGVGNFFHTEWLRSVSGESDKRPVFVPWYEIEIYRKKVTDPMALYESMDEYERGLWDKGLTLEMICWYRCKRREMPDHSAMKAEFPTDDVEAFVSTGNSVFANEHIEALRRGCCPPTATGDIAGRLPSGRLALENLRFQPDPRGGLKIWEMPSVDGAARWRYVAVVDIGGRSRSSDWSVIAVIDRAPDDGDPRPRIVAQWRGHIDHDRLAWKAAALARWYANALLVIESNTLETESEGASCLVLEQIGEVYPCLYARQMSGTRMESGGRRYGFHTNRSTKALVIAMLIGLVRDGAYMETDNDACNEMATYEQLPNGAYAARRGYHDDILMTRAIGLYVASTLPPAGTGYCAALKDLPNW